MNKKYGLVQFCIQYAYIHRAFEERRNMAQVRIYIPLQIILSKTGIIPNTET